MILKALVYSNYINILTVGLVVTECLYIRDGYHEPITEKNVTHSHYPD